MWRLIRRALQGVTQEGTSARVFAGAPYRSGGKTGTAQAVGIKANEKYNAARLAEHQRDHSLYIALAPIDAPTVALAVIVENAGFGAAGGGAHRPPRVRLPAAGVVPSEEDLAARAATGPPSAHRAGPPTCRCRAPGAAVPRARRARGRSHERWPRQAVSLSSSALALAAPAPGLQWLRRAADGGHGAAGGDRPVVMYSAGFDHGTRFVDHARNMLLALAGDVRVAQVPPQR
jgi:hypothetical protein